MDLKEFRYNTENMEEAVGHSPSNDYNPTSTPKNLQPNSGRKYAYSGPMRTVITRKDKKELLDTKDLSAVMPALESAFQMMIAAVKGTSAQNWMIGSLNMIRRRLQKQVERDQKNKK